MGLSVTPREVAAVRERLWIRLAPQALNFSIVAVAGGTTLGANAGLSVHTEKGGWSTGTMAHAGPAFAPGGRGSSEFVTAHDAQRCDPYQVLIRPGRAWLNQAVGTPKRAGVADRVRSGKTALLGPRVVITALRAQGGPHTAVEQTVRGRPGP